MKLTVFNGSPRGERSNTKIMLDEFLAGFESVPDNSFEIEYLKNTDRHEECVALFNDAETVFLAFPLYVDAMPAVVKAFIEQLGPSSGDGRTIIFMVQSGFPEASHSRRVERYLEKLARRLNCRYGGTIVKGGVEGVKVKPDWMTKKMKRQVRILGEGYARTGELDSDVLKALAKPEHSSAFVRFMFRALAATGVVQGYWNMMLKKNGAFEKRYARPYEQTS